MRNLLSGKKIFAALALTSACMGAHASTTDLGTVTFGATAFNGTVLGAGPFTDIFKFILPANSGSAYNVVNFPLDLSGIGSGTFNTVFTTLSLVSNPNGVLFDFDDALVATGTGSGNSMNLSFAASGGGTYYLTVAGIANGSSGGLYSGSIAVTAPVPEPETYGLFLAGLGLVGTIISRRRKP